MLELLRRQSLFISGFLLIIASFQLMHASISNPKIPQLGGKFVLSITSPVELAYRNSTESVKHVWERYLWLVNVSAEREELVKQLKQLEAQNSRLIEFRHENERLRTLLEFKESNQEVGVTAEVVGRDPSNWIRTITIGAGADAGVVAQLPVVDGHAIVGQTTVTSSSTSRVLLLTDSTSAIDAVVQRSRAPGIVEGSTEGALRMRYVLKEYDVQPGDRVLASGLDGVYPKGKLIGVVTRVDKTVSGLFQQVEVEPRVDFSRLETVMVLLPQGNIGKEVQETEGS